MRIILSQCAIHCIPTIIICCVYAFERGTQTKMTAQSMLYNIIIIIITTI